jgi:G3E family GTPase
LNLGPFDPAAKGTRVEAWLNAEAYADDYGDHHHHHDINRHDESVRAFSYVREQPVEIDSLQFLLQLLATMRGPDLLRVKGLVNVAGHPDTPAVLHGVQHVFHPVTWLKAWPSADRRTRLVFIVRDITKAQIAELLESLDDDDVSAATRDARA